MIEQRTEQWYKERDGKVTSSRLDDVTAKTKTGYSATRKNYMTELLLYRLTGIRPEHYVNQPMIRGIDKEPEAKRVYELRTFRIVEECGFFIAPDIEMSGASPDGLIDDDGVIEIKCPNSATHLNTILTGKIDRKYMLQMQWEMYCTGRSWCDFVSYDDRFPEHLQIFIIRVERDEKVLDEIKSEVLKFLEELDELEKQIRSKCDTNNL